MTLEELENKLKETERRLAATENALSEMTEKMRTVNDIEEIKQLQYRYLNAVIEADWDKVMDCFAEDAIFHTFLTKEDHKGKAAIDKWYRENVALNHVGKEGDFLAHPLISVSGDKATGNWLMYMMYCFPRTGQSLYWVQGYLDMEYTRENGKWKFSSFQWTERMGLPGSGPPPRGLWE